MRSRYEKKGGKGGRYFAVFFLPFLLMLNVLTWHVRGTEAFCRMKTVCAAGEDSYVNPDTGYRAEFYDEAGLMSESEAAGLKEQMQALTAYGNVAYRSVTVCYDTADKAENIYRELFGTNSGTLFFIDMDNRMLYIFSDGAMYKVLTKGYANSITDNVYRYASDGDYYACVSKAFEQELALFSGQHIFQPMKYTSNILLALLLAMLINYFIVRLFAKAKAVSDEELVSGIFEQQMVEDFVPIFTHQTKQYSPSSSGSSGGGGGGGGGSSGGGGGHSF